MVDKIDHISLGNIKIDVVIKDIKNLHLSVYPPDGNVKIAAPIKMDIDTIRVYAISKLSWIKKQQLKFKNQERESPRDFLTLESHYFLGKRYLLKIVESNKAAKVYLNHDFIEMHIKKDSTTQQKQKVLNEWYRNQLKNIIPKYISKWERIIKVNVSEFGIRKMKTKWGTCKSDKKRIWINLEMAKKPIDCLEYIIVHEMTHLLEMSHNEKFIAYITKFLPQWQSHKEELNRLPLGHTDWK